MKHEMMKRLREAKTLEEAKKIMSEVYMMGFSERALNEIVDYAYRMCGPYARLTWEEVFAREEV